MNTGVRARAGLTLIELIAVLVVLGLIATVVGASVPISPARNGGWEEIELTRRAVLRSGRDSTFLVVEGSRWVTVTVYSDGEVRRQASGARVRAGSNDE